MKASRIARIGVFIAAALVMHYIEGLLPPLFAGMPIKPGLANIFTLLALITMPFPDALLITVIRCTLGAIIGGSAISVLFSTVGGIMSYFAMLTIMPIYKKKAVSPVGISVFGAFFFNVGQLLVGVALYGTAMLAYFPVLSMLSVPTGIFVGLLTLLLIRADKWSNAKK